MQKEYVLEMIASATRSAFAAPMPVMTKSTVARPMWRALQGNVADGHLFHVQRAPGSEFGFHRVSDENVHRNIAQLRWHGVGHAFDAPLAYVAVFFVPADSAFECCRYGFGAKAQFPLRAGAIHKH